MSVPSWTGLCLFASLCLPMAGAGVLARQQQAQMVDTVPRDRLVSDRQFFELLDRNAYALATALQHLTTADTAMALQAVAGYFMRRSEPRYFFASDEVPGRLQTFVETFPAETREMQRQVDDFVQTYGRDVEWQTPGHDLLGRPHTANTIRFLARQALAVPTALLAVNAPESSYLDHLLAQAKDFVADYEAGKTESGANDVFERYYAGHRTRNWLFAHQLLLAHPYYDWRDQVFMLKTFLLHGARLFDACKKFHYGNHQLHGLEGLFEITLMFPEFPVMRYWHQVALSRILEHLEKEIKPDGFQFERASHYFKLDIMNYFRVYQLARLNGLELPPMFHERFRRMFDAIVALAKPDRTLPVLHDAQAAYATQQVAGRPVASNDAAELTDLREAFFMSLGATLFREPVYKYFGEPQLPAGLYWFLPADAGDRYAALAATPPRIGSVALEDSKYYVMRSGWSQDDLYLIIDGGLAQHKPDHTHGQVLGVIAYAFGQDVLPNYRVRYSEPSYRTLKNSLAKNVALADGMLQGRGWIDNKARTGFGRWRVLPQPVVHNWLAGDAVDYFRGSHDGFQSIGVEYTRSVFFFKPDFWLVIDEFSGEGTHDFEQIWQGDFQVDGVANRAISRTGEVELLVAQADPSVMEITTHEFFAKRSVHFKREGLSGCVFATLIQPGKSGGQAATIRRFQRPEFQQVVIAHDRGQDHIYFCGDRELSLAEIKSDAELVALRYDKDTLRAVLLHGGSRLQVAGLSVRTPTPVSCELIRQPDNTWRSKMLATVPEAVEITIETTDDE